MTQDPHLVQMLPGVRAGDPHSIERPRHDEAIDERSWWKRRLRIGRRRRTIQRIAVGNEGSMVVQG